MGLKSRVIYRILSGRQDVFDNFRRHPLEVQDRVFKSLIKGGSQTQFGADYKLDPNMSQAQFSAQVPTFDYESFKPYIERMVAGEADVASPGRVTMFAKSSGTTSDRSKYIPVSERAMHHNHMLAMRDVGMLYYNNYPDSKVYEGKFLSLGGTANLESGNLVGDLSGVLIKRFTIGSGWFRTPKMSTALIPDFEQKCEQICRECIDERVTAFVGVPSWNLGLMSRVLDYSGKSSLREVWPDLEVFIHGGIEMPPYRRAFDKLYGGDGLRYMETYNASEGFFAIADDASRDDMLLLLDHDVYYEFRSGDQIVPLEGVKMGETYAIIITMSNGLWRYEIGDTVEFTSVDPYRIRFAGRTRLYINAFGEEVIVDNSDRAIVAASDAMGAVVTDYTVAPHFMDVDEKGCHEWLIEFVTPPLDMERFAQLLDDELRAINSDYDAKRRSTLALPRVRIAPQGLFLRWLRERGKNKLPRLSNDRHIMDSIDNLINR